MCIAYYIFKFKCIMNMDAACSAYRVHVQLANLLLFFVCVAVHNINTAHIMLCEAKAHSSPHTTAIDKVQPRR